MGFFSKYVYYLVRYTFQGVGNKSLAGDGHNILCRFKKQGPPRMFEIKKWIEEEVSVPVSVVIVTYQQLNKAEYEALVDKGEVKPNEEIEI